MKVNISGGGIGGLSAAINLHKNNIDFDLYESKTDLSYPQVGLGISRNIFPILQSWGILEQCYAFGCEIHQLKLVNSKLQVLKKFTLKAPALSVEREKFHELLVAQIPKEKIRLNSFIRSSDKLAEDNRIIIVAEGAISKHRDEIYPDLKLRDSGQVLWRGKTKIPLDSSFKNTYCDFIGGNVRFGLIDSANDNYSWYAVKVGDFSGQPAKFEIKLQLKDLFKNHHPVINEVIENTAEIYKSELIDLPPASRKNRNWFKNNIVFIGDSIHPTTPNLANGACLAMEDAYVLTELLSRTNSYTSAFELYQKLREKKVNRIVQHSWIMGKLMHQKNSFLDALNLLATRFAPQFTFDSAYSSVLDDEAIQYLMKNKR